MPARWPALLLAASSIAACEPATDDTQPRASCRSSCSSPGDEHIVVKVPSERLGTTVPVELNPCVTEHFLPDGAPVVVVLSGGFAALVSPIAPDERVVATQRGIVALYPSFAVTDGDFVYDNVGDYRGAGARWATEAALWYATGALEDEDGCTLADRLAPPLSAQPPWIHGQSNGGNLAVALLADPDLDLPEISGVTTFETPAAAQFVTMEVGSIDNPLALYEPGSCFWDALEGLTCALDYTSLGWDDSAVNDEGHRGLAFFDLDGDGAYDEGTDSPVWGLRPEVEGERWIVYSPPLTQALRAAGYEPEGLLTLDEARSFWALRDASIAVTEAVAAHPESPWTILGTERDHNLGAEDHPHITGLAAALQGAGAGWVRINPDAAYLLAIAGLEAAPENPANLPTWPGDPAVTMLPEEATIELHTRDFVTAALAELMHRRWRGAWQDDLDGPLLP